MRNIAVAIILWGSASASLAQPTMNGPEYVAAAGASDLYEKRSSEIVLTDAQNDEVRSFASMMIKDHTNTSGQVKAAATGAGITPPPPSLVPKQQAMIDALTKMSGPQREKLYVQQQLAAHQEALALHSGYAKNGDDAALKQVAATAVPIIERHLNMVKKLRTGK